MVLRAEIRKLPIQCWKTRAQGKIASQNEARNGSKRKKTFFVLKGNENNVVIIKKNELKAQDYNVKNLFYFT